MIYISHRINTLEALLQTPTSYGVELDLRDYNGRLVLQHDPFKDGELFEDYLAHYRHGVMILNIKSEAIEWAVLALLQKYNIQEYFFLDSSFPMIIQLIRRGEPRVAVRFSEYESLDTVLALSGKIDWVWVDCFSLLPLDATIMARLKAAGFKVCLVSPELQGRPQDIPAYARQLRGDGIEVDAICTKQAYMDQWQQYNPAPFFGA